MTNSYLTVKSEKRDIFLDFLSLKKFRIFRHAFMLVVFYLCFSSIISKENAEALYDTYSGYYGLFASGSDYVTIIALFYINMYFLVPRLLYTKRYLSYFTALVSVASMGFFIMEIPVIFFEEHILSKGKYHGNIFHDTLYSIGMISPFIFSSTTLKLFQRWIIDAKTISELENRALESELKALRSQINPHFLFNMLNSINVLTQSDPKKASHIIFKLSDYLRYNLYETGAKQTYLSTEVKFFHDFLNLENLRRDNFTFTITQDLPLQNDPLIPSNIFITFIENAAKHSTDSKASFVNINFALINKELVFTSINSMPTVKTKTKQNNSGLGLTNVIRRLELLYGSNFNLQCNRQNGEFCVTLKLKL